MCGAEPDPVASTSGRGASGRGQGGSGSRGRGRKRAAPDTNGGGDPAKPARRKRMTKKALAAIAEVQMPSSVLLKGNCRMSPL